jgi:hypothetical protein
VFKVPLERKALKVLKALKEHKDSKATHTTALLQTLLHLRQPQEICGGILTLVFVMFITMTAIVHSGFRNHILLVA